MNEKNGRAAAVPTVGGWFVRRKSPDRAVATDRKVSLARRQLCAVWRPAHNRALFGALILVALTGPAGAATNELSLAGRDRKADATAVAESCGWQIKSFLPAGWSVAVTDNIVLIKRDQPIESYGKVSLPYHRDRAELKAKGFVRESIYSIRLEFAAPVTEAEVTRRKQENEAVIRRYNLANQPALGKPTGLPREVADRLHRIPNMLTPNWALYRQVTPEGPWMAFYDDAVEIECRAIGEKVNQVIAELAVLPAPALPDAGMAPIEGEMRVGLADRVRQSDVIAVADVREVKVANANETFEYQYVTCTLTNFLKGKAVNNPAEVVLMLKLKQEPPPDRLLAGRSYLVFLTGDWSLKPVTPTGSIVPATAVSDRFLGEVKELVKTCSPVRYVSLNVRMPGGSSADTKIHSGGKRTGGHMSGGPAPFHHMEEKTLGNPALSNVIAQAEKVFRSPVPSRPEIGTNDLVYIMIETFDRETKTYQRPRQGKFEDAGLVELDKLLHQHRIGAW